VHVRKLDNNKVGENINPKSIPHSPLFPPIVV
jgi:hypothetical protein